MIHRTLSGPVAIKAGLGKPPSDLPFDYAINQSRMTTFADCPQKAHYRYIDNIMSDMPSPSAMSFGTIWHTVRETLSSDGIVAAMEQGTELAKQYHDELDKAGIDTKDTVRFMEWLPLALQVYVDQYETPPTGKVIATEQPIWMRVSYDGRAVLFLGTVDALCEDERGSINGEIKTIGDKTDSAAFLAWRKSHPQHNLYGLALFHCEDIPPFWGTHYELAFRRWYPKKATKDATLEDRIANWPKTLFLDYPLRYNHKASMDAALDMMRTTIDFFEKAPQRNPLSCMRFGKKACTYFSVCHEGLPPESATFIEREPDYVDEAINRQETS